MRPYFSIAILIKFILAYKTTIATKLKYKTPVSESMGRKSGEWMTGVDDRILEYLYEKDPARPSEIARYDYIYCSPSYVGQRVRELNSHELVDVQNESIYQITKKGKAYLIGAYDAENEQYLHKVDPNRGARNYEWVKLTLEDYTQEAQNIFDRFSSSE